MDASVNRKYKARPSNLKKLLGEELLLL